VIDRLSLAFRYALRSLRRGGQRTVLAVFCIAVGVMAVVALRLAASMISLSLTGNVREVNGGDVSVEAASLPLTSDQLAPFARLQQQGVIERYVPVATGRGVVRRGDIGSIAQIDILDNPAAYPAVGRPQLAQPADGTFATMLAGPGSIVLAQFLADDVHARVGDRVRFSIAGGGATDVLVTGISKNTVTSGPFTVYISQATYSQLDQAAERYSFIGVVTRDDAHADQAAAALRRGLPTTSVRTAQEALTTNLSNADQISRYVQVVGLLALLIGGVGIVNTMQVALSRRRVEIAMLKTAGYRRRDLYAMFALEAAMLGLAGGVLGTAMGVGASVLARVLLQKALLIEITFNLDPGAVAIGVVVGIATALIFGLLPIVRAAGVRPAAVLRDLPEARGVGSRLQTLGLYALLVALFTGLSATLLSSVPLALGVVAGTLVLLLVLAGVFALIVTVVGRLPVPERATVPFIGLVTAAVLAAALIATVVRAVGVALLIAAASGYLVLLLPRRRKTSLMLALRSLRRTRGRTATTLVALFVGVFTIGLVLVLAQDITAKINDSLTRLANFSVFAIASPGDAGALQKQSTHLPGLLERRVTDDVTGTTPVAINGQPIAELLPPILPGQSDDEEGRFGLNLLSGIEGYRLDAGQLPQTFLLAGTALTPADAATDNVLLRNELQQSPLFLHLGDSVTLLGPSGKEQRTVHVIGFYSATASGALGGQIRLFLEPIIGGRQLTDTIGGPSRQTIVAMRFDPRQKTAALQQLQRSVPGIAILDLADIAGLVGQILSDLVILLVSLASLALFAGLVIIGNTVALAMLERRREIGILKAVGHSSASVLSQVLIENGIVGAVGAVAGMAVVTGATFLLGRFVLGTELTVQTPIVIVVVAGVSMLTVATAALVAWGPTRIRPLEVLRYE